MPDLEEYSRRLAAGEIEPPPVAQLLGFEDIDVGPDRAAISLEAGERHASATGTLHGGILCDIADGRRVARASSTLMTLRDGRADGRRLGDAPPSDGDVGDHEVTSEQSFRE